MGTAVFLLCLFPFRSLLNYYEQSHMFRWNMVYLQEQAGSLEGLAEYFISFIVQFFYVGWLGALLVALIAVLLQWCCWKLLKLMRVGWAWLYPLTLLPSLLLFFLVFVPKNYRTDSRQREMIDYDYLVRAERWSAILRKSYSQQTQTDMAVWSTNYALAQRGELLDVMFCYRQSGPDGLFMDALRMEPITLPSLSDIYLRIGMLNSAERFAFDALQQQPHKSGRLYQRLAEVTLANGHDAVARKYLLLLQPTLFYGRWATRYLAMLGDEQRMAEDKHIAHLRSIRQQANEQLACDKRQILEQLAVENSKNHMAAMYLVAYEMLCLNNERVARHAPLVRNDDGRYPKAVQECVVGYDILTHPDDSLQIPVDKDVFYDTYHYITTVSKSGNLLEPSLDAPPYRQSYWHYHFDALYQHQTKK